MSGNRNRNESSFAKLAVGAAVGALMGLAAYGVKKVYDEYEESREREQRERAHQEKPRPAKKFDDSDNSDYPSLNRATSGASGSAAASSSSRINRDEPLHVQLDHYHSSYCLVPTWEMTRAKEVVDDINKILLNFSRENLSEFGILAVRDTGSAADGLKVIRADQFDVLLHLELDPEKWMLKESEDAAGYWAVRQKDVGEMDPEKYLTPRKVSQQIRRLLQNMSENAPCKYQIQATDLTLRVEYSIHGREKTMEIKFLPALEQNSIWIDASPHPRKDVIPGYDRLWRQSFVRDEHQHLFANPSLSAKSCHLKCLRIMKAIQLNDMPHLGLLSSYVMKTVMMHMLDQEDEWSDQVLSERIFDVFLALKQYLTARELPNYFCPEMNLLEGITPQTCDLIRSFIIKNLDGGIVELLKTDY